MKAIKLKKSETEATYQLILNLFKVLQSLKPRKTFKFERTEPENAKKALKFKQTEKEAAGKLENSREKSQKSQKNL